MYYKRNHDYVGLVVVVVLVAAIAIISLKPPRKLEFPHKVTKWLQYPKLFKTKVQKTTKVL